MKKFFYFLVRVFIKITGFLPFLFLRPKFFFESEKAKKEFKKNKNGELLISNHGYIFDYYCFLYKYPFSCIKTLVADIVYSYFGLTFLNNVMGNVKIHRDGKLNVYAFQEVFDALKKNKRVLIFPEGKLEKNKGELEKFHNTYAFVSLKSGKPIQPFYVDGKYGLFHRPIFVVGEKIYPSKIHNVREITEEKVNELNNYVVRKIEGLKETAINHRNLKTKTIFTKKYWLLDFIKITSVPLFYFFFPTKKYYVGNKKEIKKALKYNALIAGNHFGPCDPLFIHLHFFKRRVRIITSEGLWAKKNMPFILERSGEIKHQRTSLINADVNCFKESLNTLKGKGVVAIFPEGHINFDRSFDSSFKQGLAALSLMSRSPIIPFIFVNPYKYFKKNEVIYGEPIYPVTFNDPNKEVNIDLINSFNDEIYQKMKELYDMSLKKRRIKDDKKPYFVNPEGNN